VSVINIISGDFSRFNFNEKISFSEMFFILAITFSNYLILLNILLCIFVKNFYEVKNDIKSNLGLEINYTPFQNIKNIIFGKINQTLENIEFYCIDLDYYLNQAMILRGQYEKAIYLDDNKNKKEYFKGNKVNNNNKNFLLINPIYFHNFKFF
jgi:hypothetical protein